MIQRCPNCGKRMYINYGASKDGRVITDCPKIKGGCGYRNVNATLR